jgi:drug/metabolite transporter (DMT)-like permease
VGRRSVFAALIAVQLLFATAPIAVKIALRELSSPTLALLRALGAAALFMILHRLLSGRRVHPRRDYLRLAGYALFGIVANQLLYITALQYTTATAAQTIVTAGPALTLFVAIVLGQERASLQKWLGILLAGSGALYLVGIGLGTGAALGNALVLCNVLAFSIFLVISRAMMARYDALTVITWVFVFGAVGIVPVGVPFALAEVGPVGSTTWLALGWIIVAPTVAAYYLNQWSLKRVEASTVALYAYLQPICTALLAIPILGERPTFRMIPAALLIFAGVGVAVWKRADVPPPIS